jgi:error-prone DNA polymerase
MAMTAMSWAHDFAHLHVASAYSLRYGVAGTAALVARAAEAGMPALALTDRDGLYGAVKHAVACCEQGIAPILGADLVLAGDGGNGPGEPGEPGRPERGPASRPPARLRGEGAPRVTLLATGKRGWGSLCRLVTAAHQAGARGAPVVTPGLVAAHAEGLVVLLGPASDVGRAVAARRPGQAAAALARWRERAEVAIEVVDHADAGGTYRAARMAGLGRAAGILVVLTNAVRYLDPADGPVAQVLDAARRLVPLGQRNLAEGRAHLAGGAEMAQIAARVCAASHRAGDPAGLLAATAQLGQRCALDPARDLGIGGRFMPETPGDPLALLRAACEAGLERLFPDRRAGRPAARERLAHELGIIARTDLASYFLTVADVARLIAGSGIRCSIRGSGAGCLVNYLIGISGINPLEHGLIMERFLSERRKGLPDIDLDVESARRIEAYRLIVAAYGEQRVACVSMMETYRARSAIRDVGAALALAPHETDAIAKAFPHIRAAHIRGALGQLPELRASGLAIPQLLGVFRLAERLDGLPRHIAMHPCGVVLSDPSLLDRTPVERNADGLPLSQFDKDDVETAGMIKLDVLGVRMQSAMAYALAEIERTTGERVDIDAVDPADEPTFEMIRSARTLGCFQIESPGQRELVGKLQPRTVGDLIVDISLFRPGPVNSDMITPYLEIRQGDRPPCYPDQSLAGPLAETGGVVVFHEQVLRILDIMTGCGLSDAELIRRALSEEECRQEVARWFHSRALARGYHERVVDRVWEVLAAFGAFGFCKAHAAAFAIPTYQSAWLKRHYPAAFFAGVLTHDPGMYPKRVIVGDARLHGIPILPVDVNACTADWRVERAGPRGGPDAAGLRPGLREIKGISDAEVAQIVAGQPYTSLRDFWERGGVSRPVAERLVLVGAFDSLYHRSLENPPSTTPLPGGGPGGDQPSGGQPSGEPPHGGQLGGGQLGGGSPSGGGQLGGGSPSGGGQLGEGSPSGGGQPGGGAPRGQPGGGASHGGQLDGRSPPGGRAPHDGLPGGGSSGGGRVSRRDLLARVGALDRSTRRPPRSAAAAQPLLPGLGDDGDGFAELVPAGQLRELSAPERVQAELEILGIDLSEHVLGFYAGLLAELGVVRATTLHRQRQGARVLVAGVKVATQTPAVRSGQRIIFATLDDATGPVDLVFFESAQERCAARVFGSWLLVVRGRLRKVGRSVSVTGTECWDLPALAQLRAASGTEAVRAAMAAGDVPGSMAGGVPGPTAAGGHPAGAASPPADAAPSPGGGPPSKIIYPNGFALSPFAETGAPGGGMKSPPRRLWHASQGSSGDPAGP